MKKVIDIEHICQFCCITEFYITSGHYYFSYDHVWNKIRLYYTKLDKNFLFHAFFFFLKSVVTNNLP